MASGETARRRERAHGDPEEVRVLHLDDDEEFLTLAAERLEREGLVVETETHPQTALSRLDDGAFDCVVSDYQMPTMDGIEFLEAVRETRPELPFLLFTGKGSEEIAGRAISAGVTDYLRKKPGPDRFTLLANRIENTVAKHRAEQRAAASDRRVREVHDRISDAVVALDADWRYTYVNGRAEEVLGVAEADLLGESMWERFPDLLDTTFEDAFREAMRTQEPTTVEARNDLTESWYEARAYPDEDGISIYFRDTTERRERERRYEAIFNQTYQFTGLMEPDGTLLEANRTALEFGSLDREDVVGRKIWETHWFQHGEAAEVARSFVERASAGEFVRTELDVQGADGIATIDFSVRPVTDEGGEVVLLIPEGRDVTELTERKRDLREARAFTESIFAAMPDPLYAFDQSGSFLRWNDRLEEVTGYDPEEIDEMTPVDFVPDDEVDRVAETIARVFEADEDVTLESYFETKSGERLPYEFTGARLTDQDGEVVGLVGVGRDITERKRRERELRRQNERIEEFARVVSHDFRNRLSVAAGSLSLVDGGKHVARAERALDRMDGLIDDVLYLAKQGHVADDLDTVTAGDVVRRAVDAVDTGSTSVTVEVPDDRRVLADPRRLPELIESLVENAVEHGGERVRVALEGDTLSVADDGPGIPAESRDEVLAAGYSTSGDTGFGLAIAVAIAEGHGWTVSVGESDLGGARFDVSGIESAGEE